jgi:hypothetical protein
MKYFMVLRLLVSYKVRSCFKLNINGIGNFGLKPETMNHETFYAMRCAPRAKSYRNLKHGT